MRIILYLCISHWERLESMLRSEWQLQHHTTYCLYGSKMHMMKKIFNNSRSPFYKFGQMMQLKRISKEYWLPYIVNNFEAMVKTRIRNSLISKCAKCMLAFRLPA